MSRSLPARLAALGEDPSFVTDEVLCMDVRQDQLSADAGRLLGRDPRGHHRREAPAQRAAASASASSHSQNMRFDAAVNNMSQGLCMFDREQRLVICNRRYADIYSLPPDMVGPAPRCRRS